MLQTFFSFLIMTLLFIDPLWARPTADVEREYDAFRATVNPRVHKAEQFLEDLTKKGQVDDVVAILNKGDGVRCFSKKDRKFTLEEEKIALNALFFAKKNKPGVFPFVEPIDSFGSKAVQRHRHFVKVAWRLLDPALGYVNVGADFKTDERAYKEFRALVRTHMKIGNSKCQLDNFTGAGTDEYFTYGVGITKQASHKIPTVPHFHAYHYISPSHGIKKRPSTTIRFRLPTKEMRQHLPEGIKGKISGITDENLDIFVLSQNLPWPDDKEILYRPHYYLDYDAPYQAADYSHAFNVSLSSFPSIARNTIPHEEGPITLDISTHTNGDPEVPGIMIVSSPPTPVATMLTPEKRRENFSFYTLTGLNNIVQCTPPSKTQTSGRYALTLHLMLNEATQRKLARIPSVYYYNPWKKKARESGVMPLLISYEIPVYELSELIDSIPEIRQLYPFGF
ncbi:MAG: hypothetical protein K2Q34_05945 [Alphaproteobacteria bacterium]|nr:hypothetical protein [Alphaproteobacteria bacterium]